MPAATLTIWDSQDCRRAHEATLAVLDRCGVEVHGHPRALELFSAAGARIQGTRARLSPDVVERALATAPRSWPVFPRGGEAASRAAAIHLRDGESYFGPGSDCIYIRDPQTARLRQVTVADVEGLADFCERLPNIDFVMSMGLPADVSRIVDDLAAAAAMFSATRKPLLVAPKDGLAVGVLRDMAVACGDREAASVMVYAMPSPPLQHDGDALGKVIACAELEVPLIYASAPSCGTTAPRSVPAAVVVGNADVLSGLVLHQSVRPGAPFVFGAGVGATDMRTGFDGHGAPEAWLGQQLGADLARFYGLPSFNYAGMTDANELDEQWAAEEFAFTVLGALQRSTLLHDVGYLQVGLQSSYESLVFGDECVGWARTFLQQVRVDAEAFAVAEIIAVGPGGHHLARRQTRRRNRDFWIPAVFDRSVCDRWAAEGSRTLKDRVRAKVAALRAEEPPYGADAATRRALGELVDSAEKRRLSVGT
jgi:trimethylamine--corrinoid protein Co-methyltransferase